MSVYVQQQQLLKRYQSLVCVPDIEALMAELWGPGLTDKQMYGSPNADGFIDRIDDHVPEILLLMEAAGLDRAAELLALDTLSAFIRYVLDQGNGLKRREADPRLKKYKATPLADFETDPGVYHNDDWRLKAAGIDRLSRECYASPHNKNKPLAGAALRNVNTLRARQGLTQLAPAPQTAGLTARQVRRRQEKARAAERAGTPAPAVPPRPVIVPAKPKPAPKPVVVLLPLAQVFPKATPKPAPRKWQPWHGQQLALWPDAAPAGLT